MNWNEAPVRTVDECSAMVRPTHDQESLHTGALLHIHIHTHLYGSASHIAH